MRRIKLIQSNKLNLLPIHISLLKRKRRLKVNLRLSRKSNQLLRKSQRRKKRKRLVQYPIFEMTIQKRFLILLIRVSQLLVRMKKENRSLVRKAKLIRVFQLLDLIKMHYQLLDLIKLDDQSNLMIMKVSLSLDYL